MACSSWKGQEKHPSNRSREMAVWETGLVLCCMSSLLIRDRDRGRVFFLWEE